MARVAIVILLSILTAPFPALWSAEPAGLPGWVWQLLAGAFLFAVLVALLLQRHWDEE